MNAEKALPPVLDVTCGGRMMWFDKHNPLALYVDNREVPDVELCDGRSFSVEPDIIADFRKLPFPDDSFNLVVFDPPHLVRAGEDSYMKTKYGKLEPGWETTLHDGFVECMRVLRPGGTLIFKWNEYQVPVRDVLKAIGEKPLFGHRSGKASKTHWMVFIKPGKIMPSDWVSVDDHLPEDDLSKNTDRRLIPCLVTTEEGEVKQRTRERWVVPYGKSAKYIWLWDKSDSAQPTHWLPIPEAAKRSKVHENRIH